jgi:uncharacterized protein
MALARNVALASVAALAALWLSAGAVLCDNALIVPRRLVPDAPPAWLGAARWQSAEVRARDGARLRGCLLDPPASNGAAVLLLHGIADSRVGESGMARLLLAHGYRVLMTDGRAQGESGGAMVTYGLLERDDVHRWAAWLDARKAGTRLYAVGESLGAAVLLQALPGEHRFRAAIAECPFADFTSVARYRVAQKLPAPARWLATPLLWSGLMWARRRYGLDLRAASPLAAAPRIVTPVLLIRGLADTNIPWEQSRRIRDPNPREIALWLARPASLSRAFWGGSPGTPGSASGRETVIRQFSGNFLPPAGASVRISTVRSGVRPIVPPGSTRTAPQRFGHLTFMLARN